MRQANNESGVPHLFCVLFARHDGRVKKKKGGLMEEAELNVIGRNIWYLSYLLLWYRYALSCSLLAEQSHMSVSSFRMMRL